MTTESDLNTSSQLGLDAVGIVVEYPTDVPWNLTRGEGRQLAQSAPSGLEVVMVCSGKLAFLQELVSFVEPDAVQLHGDETVAETTALVEWCKPKGIRVFKALRIDPETGKARGEMSDPVAVGCAMAEAGVSAVVIDSHSPKRPGGTGISVDTRIICRIMSQVKVPVIVAGGLTACSVGAVIQAVHPYGVDVLSGVESKPRTKDPHLMSAFAAAARKLAF